MRRYSRFVNAIRRVIPSHRLLRFFSRFGTFYTTYPNDCQMVYRPDDATNQYAFYGHFSSYIRDFILTLNRGDVFIDIGANCGFWALLASGRVGPDGKVLAFEPQQRVFHDLISNIDANRSTNVIPINAAIGSDAGWVGITLENKAHSGAGYVSYGAVEALLIDGEMINRTLLAAPFTDARFGIKIDVEGFEFEVLKSIGSALRRPGCGFVIVECDAVNLMRYGASTEELHAFMRQLGLKASVCETAPFPNHYDEVFVRQIESGPKAHENTPIPEGRA